MRPSIVNLLLAPFFFHGVACNERDYVEMYVKTTDCPPALANQEELGAELLETDKNLESISVSAPTEVGDDTRFLKGRDLAMDRKWCRKVCRLNRSDYWCVQVCPSYLRERRRMQGTNTNETSTLIGLPEEGEPNCLEFPMEADMLIERVNSNANAQLTASCQLNHSSIIIKKCYTAPDAADNNEPETIAPSMAPSSAPTETPVEEKCCPAGYTGWRSYDSCASFYPCQNGSVLPSDPVPCQSGLLFDQSSQNCNWAHLVTCQVNRCGGGGRMLRRGASD